MEARAAPGKGMRVLVTGAGGMLGRAVVEECGRRGWEVAALGRRDLDVAEPGAVCAMVERERPDAVVNCAAYTDVDGAEAEEAEALRVNGLGPRNLALACAEAAASGLASGPGGPLLVHVSTDYVFDGAKGSPYGVYDEPAPLSVYGRTKLWGERAVREIWPRHLVVRTSWLFGPGGRNFVDTILRLARERLQAAGWSPRGGAGVESRAGCAAAVEPLRVVDDQRGSPTYTVDLARAMADLVEHGALGTYHVTNAGVTTWYDLARAALAAAGLGGAVPVLPVGTAEFPRPARRPAYSALDPFPLRETLGYLLPPWQDAVRRHTARLLLEQQGTVVEPQP